MSVDDRSAQAPEAYADAVEGPRWDPLVRLAHWGVAAVVLLNGLFTEGGEALHVALGWGAAALLGLRLFWGLVGPEEARFSAFPPSLSGARGHLSDIAAGRRRPQRSHNPLGALMAYALWGVLALVVATGIAMAGGPFPETDAREALATPIGAAMADEDGERYEDDDAHAAREGDGEEENEALEEVHEAAATLLLILSALHVAGVAFETRRFGIDLVGPMTLGGRRRP